MTQWGFSLIECLKYWSFISFIFRHSWWTMYSLREDPSHGDVFSKNKQQTLISVSFQLTSIPSDSHNQPPCRVSFHGWLAKSKWTGQDYCGGHTFRRFCVVELKRCQVLHHPMALHTWSELLPESVYLSLLYCNCAKFRHFIITNENGIYWRLWHYNAVYCFCWSFKYSKRVFSNELFILLGCVSHWAVLLSLY